jgi:hypothetical protein
MKYDRYDDDARAFGRPPAYFMSMIARARAHDYAADKQRLRVDSAPEVGWAWRSHRGWSITVIAAVAAALTVAALLL